MKRHILKLFFRDILKHKTFSIINLMGLSIAISCSFLIYLFIIFELNYNKHNQNYENIYRVLTSFQVGAERTLIESATPYNLSEAMIQDFPEVIASTRIFNFNWYADDVYIQKDELYIHEPNFRSVEPGFFKIFTINWLEGDVSAFRNPEDVILSKSAVDRYFDGISPVGQELVIKNNAGISYFNIVGIYEDIPGNSTFKADIIGNFEYVKPQYEARQWRLLGIDTYILTSEDSKIDVLRSKLPELCTKYHPESSKEYHLQAMEDIHFGSSHLDYYDYEIGNKYFVVYLGMIALIIMLIATVNYIIMATAKSMGRYLEIGIRKVVGASRRKIIRQVTAESFLFIALIFPLSLMISEMLLPAMNNMLGKEMAIHYFSNIPYLTGIFVIIILLGLLSGWYISFYISRFQPEHILRAKFTSKKGKAAPKQLLMLVQLASFLVLFIFTGFIFKQINYMQESDLGYKHDNLLILQPPHDHHLYSCAAYLNNIKSIPEVESASEITCGLYTTSIYKDDFFPYGKQDDYATYTVFVGDFEMIESYNLEVIDGRGFDPNLPSDSSMVLINESAAKLLDYKNPVGELLGTFDPVAPKIIGVVTDFNISSLHQPIPPMIIKINEPNRMITQLAVRFNGKADIKTLLQKLEGEWEKSGPNGMFKYYFMSDKLTKLYKDDINFGKLIRLFTAITIVISLLGMYGLSVFTTKKRNKEIGIRKAFGANFSNIIQLLTKDFAILIIISNAISWPIAYYISSRWMQNFAYKTGISIPLFLIALIFSITFIAVIIAYNTYKAAKQNPADIIRYE